LKIVRIFSNKGIRTLYVNRKSICLYLGFFYYNRKDELFKKMEVYTIFKSKVYLITFTAQDAIFSNYMPVVKKMIDSFEVGK